ncbi:pyrroloquinoline quinone precursor peptide PqqA [Streptomyces antibioticus]
MNETTERTPQPAAAAPTTEHTGHGTWQTPGYTVVDTALEVTAYSLAAR